VSVVYGLMPPDAYRAAKADASTKPGPTPFFAAGISSVSFLSLSSFSVWESENYVIVGVVNVNEEISRSDRMLNSCQDCNFFFHVGVG